MYSVESFILTAFVLGLLLGTLFDICFRIYTHHKFNKMKKEFLEYFDVSEVFYSYPVVLEALEKRKKIIYENKTNNLRKKIQGEKNGF